MSTWGIGLSAPSEETQVMRERLSSKDAECADLQTQLIKRTAEINELTSTLNETLHKLNYEAQRARSMEKDLKQCTEDLKNEKLISHNIQASLTAAKQHIRDNDNAARQLESTLDTLSHHSADVKARADRLERDKSAAEARVRELEVALRQAKASAGPSAIPVSRAPSRTGRRRSSSLAPPMSQELTEARTMLSKKEADLRVTSDKLARAQNELNRCENEKAAVEKRLGAQLRELQANMEEKNNEIEWLRAEQGDGEGGASAREAELVRRIEEDTAKMAALEMLVREQPEADSLKKALKRAEQMLKVEAQRVAEAEARHVDLVAEKEAALDELEAAQAHVRELTNMVEDDERRIHAITMNERNLTDRLAEAESRAEQLGLNLAKTIPSLDVDMDCDSPRHAPQASTESLARLLSAIERLRGERDSAKGDLSFALTEMRFANEAREAERAAAGARDNELRAQLAKASTYADIMRRKDEYIRRSNLAATASFVALGYLQSKALITEDESNIMSAQLTGVQALLEDARKTCATRERMIAGMTEEISSLEIRFNVTSLDLEAAVTQRTNLFSQIKRLEAKEVEWAVEARRAKMAQQQAEETLKQHAAQLVETTKALEQVESQRDSLNLHLTNVQADLETAQKQLASAEGRYSALQSQRLASMSSSQVTQAMRQQIEDLEDRVLRRTEQIGIQQHDIRRLETNLKLQEERLGEMTEELDMMRAEKQAMVEDCADAREARDDAVQRLEVLEVEAESREEQLSHIAEQLTQRNLHLGTMVELIAGTAPREKAAAQSVRRSFGMPQKAEANYAQAVEGLKQLCQEYERDARLLDDKTSAVEALEARLSTSEGEIRQMTFDLAAARTQLQVLQQTNTEVKTGAKALEDKMDALTRESSETSTVLNARICELRSQVRQLEDEKATILAKHESVVQELRTQLETVQADTSSEDELRLLQAKHTEELRSLQDHLDQTTMELAEAKKLCADSQKLYDEQHNLVEELSGATEVLKSRIAELADKSLIANRQLDETTSGHQKQTQELQIQLDEATKALQNTERKLRDETESRATDKEAFSNELQRAAEQCRLAESLQEELRQQVTNTRKSLEALTQESACQQASLTEALERTRTALVTAENTGNAAQLKLSFQKAEYEHLLASLRREVETLKSKPDLTEAIAELEKKNREMEELLRAKSAEVEENDDQFIEMLKEKKKLISKIESLSRKVLSLQGKLAEAKTVTIPPPTSRAEVQDPPITIAPHRQAPIPSVAVPGSHAQPSKTVPQTADPRGHPVTPSTPESGRIPSTPTGRLRTISQSALPRPKTPEKRAAQPVVSQPGAPDRPKSPEKRATRPAPAPMRAPEGRVPPWTFPEIVAPPPPAGLVPSIGKKRPPPDEFESPPRQGFTPDSLPVSAEPTTPRMRKMPSSHTGFTPVRHAAVRPTIPLPSPRRRTAPADQLIADVTNNPRATVNADPGKPTKRSWLGKIRGTSQTTTRPNSSSVSHFEAQ